MLRLILAGCHGRMGRQLSAHCCNDPSVTIVAGVTRTGTSAGTYPIFSDLNLCSTPADVLVDFSAPGALTQLLNYCTHRKLPAVLAVTGYSQQQLEQIRLASYIIPIFHAANLSIGANLLLKLTKQAAEALGPNFGATITERHHHQKRDSPSGTALALAQTLINKAEIFSIRSGTTAGEHTVMFAGPDEVLELVHRADSREVYAAGAIRAAHFLSKISSPGLYDMDDLLTQK